MRYPYDYIHLIIYQLLIHLFLIYYQPLLTINQHKKYQFSLQMDNSYVYYLSLFLLEIKINFLIFQKFILNFLYPVLLNDKFKSNQDYQYDINF